jgi:hypothetical protein
MILGRRNITQGSAKPAVIVIIHEFNDRHIGFCEAVELIPAQAFGFQYRIEGLDVGVLIRRPHRNALVFDAQFIADCLKAITDKLRTVIRANNHSGIADLTDPPPKGALRHAAASSAVQLSPM